MPAPPVGPTPHRCADGVQTICPTPFHEDPTIDFDRIAPLVDYQVAAGVTGLVILGSTENHVEAGSGEYLPCRRPQPVIDLITAKVAPNRLSSDLGPKRASADPAVRT